MDPFTIAAIVSGLASTAVNAYVAYKQGEISEAEYRRATQAANELERQLKALRPDENWENINPALLSETAKFSPDIAAFVQENAPELIQEAGSNTEKRVQREALQKYAAMSETGRDVISEAQREQALFESDARAKQRQRALMDALRRQGQLGSGAALQAQLAGEQAEAVNARQAALQGVQEAEMRRRQALGQAAGLAGQIRGQNLNVESANVGTMNAYNQRLANAKNMYNQYASNQRNQAQMINQQREMERERYNLGLQNQYAMFNRQQRDAAKERARQYDVDRVNRMFDVRSGAERNRADGQRAEMAGYGTAITNGIGTGMGVYSMGMRAGGGGLTGGDVGQAAVDGLARGSAYQGGQQLVNSMFSSPVDTTPQYMGPVPAKPYSQILPQTRNAYMGGPWRPQGDNEFIDVEQESFELPEYTRKF
jgi:hypothetical protein